MTPPRFCRRPRTGRSLIPRSWWNKLFKTQEQGLREKLSLPSLSLLFEHVKIAIRANTAKLQLQFLLFFTLQALRSGSAVPLQSAQHAARLQITAATTATSSGKTESQNHRMVGVGRDLCGSSSPTLLLKQGHLQQAVEDLVQAGLEYLQRRRLHNLPDD